MVWAFATVNEVDVKLFATFRSAAEQRVSEFKPQEQANTAWACATVNHMNEKLFMALASTAGQQVRELKLP